MPDVREFDYLRHGDQTLVASLYRPAGSGPFRAVVEVHGGAWTTGDRFNNVATAEALAAAGIVVLSIEFRMAPKDPYPAAVADVNFAIRWLKVHATEFGSRPDLVGGLGTSSGGHLILLSAVRPTDPRYSVLPGAPGHDAGLAYVVACWPVADPLARYRLMKERRNDRLVQAHHQFWPSEAAMADGNPQLIVERGEAQAKPPALLLQGTSDDNLTPDMAARFAAAYR